MFKVQNMPLQLTSVLANQVIGTCIMYVIKATIVRMYIRTISEPCECANFFVSLLCHGIPRLEAQGVASHLVNDQTCLP